MASRGEGGGLGARRSQPPDQEREREKDGRLRRIICDILTLRVLAYVIAQPAAFSFVVSLFLIAACMPAIGQYIASADQLPDLFSMRIWNAYIGNLQDQKFCAIEEKSPVTCNPHEGLERVDVAIGFEIDRDFCRSLGGCPEDTQEESEEELPATGKYVDFLLGEFSGLSLKTKIKDKVSGERVDGNLTIRILLSLNSAQDCSHHHCPIDACVSIIAPPNAIPTRLPHIPEDFSFNSKLYHSVRRPPGQCAHNCSLVTPKKTVRKLEIGHNCKGHKKTVLPSKEKYRHHGLINIYLEEEDQKTASFRLQLAAVGVAAFAIAITIAIAFTDRPPKPKPGLDQNASDLTTPPSSHNPPPRLPPWSTPPLT